VETRRSPTAALPPAPAVYATARSARGAAAADTAETVAVAAGVVERAVDGGRGLRGAGGVRMRLIKGMKGSRKRSGTGRGEAAIMTRNNGNGMERGP
jgi:hypothetical protein